VRPSTTAQPQHFSISISSEAGRLLSSEYHYSATDCGIDLSGLEQGFYLLRVMDEASQQVTVHKLAQLFVRPTVSILAPAGQFHWLFMPLPHGYSWLHCFWQGLSVFCGLRNGSAMLCK